MCGLSRYDYSFGFIVYLVAISVVNGLMWNVRRYNYLLSLYWLTSNVFHTVLCYKTFLCLHWSCRWPGDTGHRQLQGWYLRIVSGTNSYNWLFFLVLFFLICKIIFFPDVLFYFLCICSLTIIVSTICVQKNLSIKHNCVELVFSVHVRHRSKRCDSYQAVNQTNIYFSFMP